MAPYTVLLLAGLVASVAATPLKQASLAEVVAFEKRGPLRRDQASNMSVQLFFDLELFLTTWRDFLCRPIPNPGPAPKPTCSPEMGSFYIASVDANGRVGYLTQDEQTGDATFGTTQDQGVLFTLDAACHLSSVSAPNGPPGSANQLYDYAAVPSADKQFLIPFSAARSIPSGGRAIACTTGGSDENGNFLTCCACEHTEALQHQALLTRILQTTLSTTQRMSASLSAT